MKPTSAPKMNDLSSVPATSSLQVIAFSMLVM
jgi:hypothetical protein